MNLPSDRTCQPIFFYTAILFSLILWVYAPVMYADFINFDDTVHVLRNPFIRDLSFPGLKNIFTTCINKTYIPLTELSFAIEHYLFGFDPRLFHLTNLVLHLVVSFLVMKLAWRMGSAGPAGFLAAVIFAIHPMHVESVAWVTELKDVLYAFFYLLAIYQYINYLHETDKVRRRWVYSAVLVCALASSLAKAMALSLPLILFLYDLYSRRPRGSIRLWDKAPVIAVIFPSVLVTHMLLLRTVHWSWPESLLLWIWTLVFYPMKFWELGNYVYLYWIPRPAVFSNPAYGWAVALVGGFCILLWVLRRHRWLTFTAAYYLASIFFILRMEFGSELNMVADRFMYLPSVSICLAVGYGLWKLSVLFAERFPLWGRGVGVAGCIVIIGFLAVKGHHQVRVWQDSETFWRHQLVVEPRAATAVSLHQLGYGIMPKEGLITLTEDLPRDSQMEFYPISSQLSRIAQIRELFNQALAIKPDFDDVYYHRGILALRLGDNTQAREDWRQTLSVNPEHFLALFALGRLELLQGQPQAAVEAFRQAIKIIPDHEILRKDILQAYRTRIDLHDPHADIYQREIEQMKAQ